MAGQPANLLDYLRAAPGEVGGFFSSLAAGPQGVAPASDTPPDTGAADLGAGDGPMKAVNPGAPQTILQSLPKIRMGPVHLSALTPRPASANDDSAAAPAPAAMPQRPVQAVHSWIVNAIDKGFLGGGIQEHDKQELAAKMAGYMAPIFSAYAEKLPTDGLKAQFWADPQGFIGANEKNLEQVKLGQGESLGSGAQGVTATAPLFDEKSGSVVQPGPNATVAASPSVGGDVTAKDGLVLSGRTGVVGKYALPQIVAPGARIGTVTPGVTAGAGPSATALPRLPLAPPGGIPTVADLPSVLPGARLTSGLRSPTHNAAVGGVPNSYHLQGTEDAPGALDLTPAPGESMADFNARVQAAAPGAKVLNEGNHIHVQPQARSGTAVPVTAAGPQTDATGSVIDQGGATGPLYSPPTWNPQNNRFEQKNTATGEVHDAGAGTFDPAKLRSEVLGHEDYKQATASLAAYKAMIGNADKMTGPSAYSMLDTFARAINPGAVARPQVIQTIEQNLGLPAQFVGGLESKFGKGNLPPEVRQQILDAVVKFSQAHWDAANQLNQGNVAIATRTGLDPRNVTAPLDERPTGAHLTLPPKDHLQTGDVYLTSRGMARWTGKGFVPYGG